ncbi:MAG: hypothetical protein NC395_02480 [Prevotella sp.]|nr:hypothetical protein [Prevotella sp.]
MAFMGLVFVGIALAVLGTLLFFALLFFVIGLIIRKKHKTASKVLFTLSGVNFAVTAGTVIYVVSPHPMTVETPDGTASLKPSWISEYKDCIAENDIEGLDRLFGKHPDMIYYYDVNHVMPLDYAMYNTNVPMMKCAVEHGAVFDDPIRYEHRAYECGSLCSFFGNLDYPDWERSESELHKAGVVTDDILETVRFALENGASAVHMPFGNHTDDKIGTLYENMSNWVRQDGDVSPNDEELLKLIQANLP